MDLASFIAERFLLRSDLRSSGGAEVLKINLAKIEDEMRVLAEERIRSLVGDTPVLTRTQTARVWNKSSSWVKQMEKEGRVPIIPFGRVTKIPRAAVVIGLVKGV
jgi:hypothetical protein